MTYARFIRWLFPRLDMARIRRRLELIDRQSRMARLEDTLFSRN